MTNGKLKRTRRILLVLGVVLLAACALVLGRPSIHTAAREGDMATVEKLLKRGCNPDKRSWRNSTPLIEAASAGHLDVVELLVENGADVNKSGETTFQKPLHFAAYEGHVEIVEFLLKHGANVDNALHSAAMGGQIEIAGILLENRADIDQKGVDEATPLETAVSSGQVEMAEFLLAHGADVNAQGLYGRTALHVAAMKDDLTIGKILLDHGADPTLKYNGNPVRPNSVGFRELLASYEGAR